jgi:hypothetical protein
LLRLDGQYLTFDQLREHVKAQAAAYRGAGSPCADAVEINSKPDQSAGQSPTPESENSYPLLTAVESTEWFLDRATGEQVPITRIKGRAYVDRRVEGCSLPCRSLETTQSRIPGKLSGPHQKVALALSWNVAHLCRKYGQDRVGFLTLTFADHVTDVREASKRFNSLASNVLRSRYEAFIRVLERQKNGRIHYHLLVVLRDDIRTGADFEAFAKKDYRSANPALRLEWAYWRKTSPQFRFGRTELMPIRSDAGAMGQYVGKYIGKHIGQREERDKGARLVSYSKGSRMASSKFMQRGEYPDLWRAKVCTFVRQLAAAYPHRRIRDTEDVALHLGNRWSYTWRDYILALPPADLTVPF